MAGFADTAAFIDEGIAYYDNTGASDADNTTRRARWLAFTQQALDEIWISGDYVFSYITGTVSFSAATDSADLPADFMEFGEVGGIWNSSTTDQLEQVRPIEAYSGVVAGRAGEGEAQVSDYGLNASTMRRVLHLPGNAGSAQTIKILYRKVAPTLVDTTTDATSNLWQLPLAYQNTVLMPLVVSKIRSSLGDSRQFLDQYLAGLSAMAKRERARKTTTQRLPSSIRMF